MKRVFRLYGVARCCRKSPARWKQLTDNLFHFMSTRHGRYFIIVLLCAGGEKNKNRLRKRENVLLLWNTDRFFVPLGISTWKVAWNYGRDWWRGIQSNKSILRRTLCWNSIAPPVELKMDRKQTNVRNVCIGETAVTNVCASRYECRVDIDRTRMSGNTSSSVGGNGLGRRTERADDINWIPRPRYGFRNGVLASIGTRTTNTRRNVLSGNGLVLWLNCCGGTRQRPRRYYCLKCIRFKCTWNNNVYESKRASYKHDFFLFILYILCYRT